MKESGRFLMRTGLVLFVAAAVSSVLVAAEASVLAQDLVKVRASGKALAVLWTRRPDSYTLQVVLDKSRPVVTGAVISSSAGAEVDRSIFFIGNTIANLRGLDPAFGCRTLKLVDGRRFVGDQSVAPPIAGEVAAAAGLPAPKEPSVQVWLLRADGTQILPHARSPKPADTSCQSNSRGLEYLYRFSIAESVQAVAAAIRIDDEYYIEKLLPFE